MNLCSLDKNARPTSARFDGILKINRFCHAVPLIILYAVYLFSQKLSLLMQPLFQNISCNNIVV